MECEENYDDYILNYVLQWASYFKAFSLFITKQAFQWEWINDNKASGFLL